MEMKRCFRPYVSQKFISRSIDVRVKGRTKQREPLLVSFLCQLSHQPPIGSQCPELRSVRPWGRTARSKGLHQHYDDFGGILYYKKHLQWARILSSSHHLFSSPVLTSRLKTRSNHVYLEALHSYQAWPTRTRTSHRYGALDALSRQFKARPRPPRGRILQPEGYRQCSLISSDKI